MNGKVTRLDRDLLNASAGVYLMDHRLCVALVFQDILNNYPSVSTSAYADYLETVRTTNMNRYALLSLRYVSTLPSIDRRRQRTRMRRPTRRMVLGVMLLSLHRRLTVVWYLPAILPRLSPWRIV